MNRQILWLLFLVLIWPKPLLAQLPGNATLVLFPGVPTGNCNSRQLALDESTGSLYTCVNAAHGNQGTWQIIAGGGGAGGWNPPSNTPGNTIFGNNSVGTGSPSFFTPGGDVSFSAGNFSVNSLHFGPNALALTNTGIATGNCLQVSGSNIIGGACGTGGGGGLSGSGTVNLVPKWTAATALGNSLLTDDGTTLTYTGTGGIVAPKVSITQGPLQFTSVEGALPALPGANNNMLVSGPDGWYVSNANSAFFKIEPPGTGGTGGAVTSVFGRTGAILAANNDYSVSQVTGAAPLASPAFTGTPTAPAPTGAAATAPGNTQIATTAFVFAHVGAGGGVTGTGTTNYITKWTGASAIGDTLLSDNGTVLNYTGTGGITTAAPVATENSNRVATTAWVKANFQASGGGGGGTGAIQPSAQPPGCYAQDLTTTNTLTVSSLNILAGDTVVVSVGVAGGTNTSTVTDSGSSVYTQRVTRNWSAGGYTSNIVSTDAGAAHAATSLTVTNTNNGKFVVCLAAYTGVNALGNTNNNIGTSVTSGATTASPSLSVQDDNGFIFASVSAAAVLTQASGPNGSVLATASTTTANSPNSTAICGYTVTTAATTSCDVTWTVGTAIAYGWTALELRPGVATGPTPVFPKVVAYRKANVTATTTAATDTAFMTCSATDCPPGYYRVTWDFLSLGSGCTNGQVIVNVDYYDEYDLTTVYHTGIGSLSNIGPGRNHVYWVRMMTVAKPFSSTVGIQFTTSTTACSSGTGTAQQTVSVERLQ